MFAHLLLILLHLPRIFSIIDHGTLEGCLSELEGFYLTMVSPFPGKSVPGVSGGGETVERER